MKYYFEVTLYNKPNDHILVKARDVIEAGQKVASTLAEQGYGDCEELIIEITRTNIAAVIIN